MTQQKSRIPTFKNRQELARFWDTHDVADFVDELKPVNLTFDLEQPKEETVMFRLDAGVKQYLTHLARNKGLSTSSLLRMWIMEKFNQINHTT